MSLFTALLKPVFAVLTAISFGIATLYWIYGPEGLHKYSIMFEYTGYPDRFNMSLLKAALEIFKNHNLAFWTHVIFSPIALVAGLLQFYKTGFHKLFGYLYIICSVIGIPAGIAMGHYDYLGYLGTFGFWGMGLTTLTCVVMAYCCILWKDYESHREWTIRSYFVMWSSVVAFRLGILLWIPTQMKERTADRRVDDLFYEPYAALVFLSWSVPLLVADVFIQLTKKKKNQ